MHIALAVLSLTLGTLFFPFASHAGTYFWQTTDASGNITGQSPTFTGGTVSVVTWLHLIGRGLPPPPAFSTSKGYYTGGGGCVTSSTQPNNAPGSVKVNSPAAPIVATFTWQATSATDLPPPAAIVEQDCTASWSQDTVTNDGSATGTADCGLPGPPPTVTTDLNGKITGVSNSGTKYSVVTSPGASFSVPAQSNGQYKPSATFSANAGTTGAASGGASVDYQVQAFPIFVVPGGAIQDTSGNYNILIGQHCNASLSGIPAVLLNNTASPPTYQWSVSGTTFQTWSADTPPFPVMVGGVQIGIIPENPDATYEVDGPGPLTNSTAGWYWNDLAKGTGNNTQETVSCTATVTPPTGQGAALTVTATTPITVWTPVWTATGNGASVVVDNTFHAPDFWLHAGPGPLDFGATHGMTWDATLSPPSAPVPFGIGSLAIVQIVTGCDQGMTSNTTPPLSIPGPGNGQTGLDTSWPYGWTISTTIVGGMKYESGDAPGIRVTDLRSAHYNISFEDYLMYCPPSSVQYVPLAKYIWSANMGASLPATGNWINFTGTAGTVTDAQKTGQFLPNNKFPAWTDIVTAQ